MAETTNEPVGTTEARRLRILFVCTGNVCRSPMAEALMRLAADERGLPVEVASAGLLPGVRQVDRRVVARIGKHIHGQKSRELDERLVRGADFILAMTADHVLQIVGRFPEAMPRTHTVRHFLKHLSPRSAADSVFEWAEQSNSAARHNYAQADEAGDIPDPVDAADAVFDALLAELSNAAAWIGLQISPSTELTGDVVSILTDESAEGLQSQAPYSDRPTAFSDLASRG